MYKLRDLADEVIDNIFYKQELTQVEKNLEEEQSIVDRVIKSKRWRANKQVLVSWRSYSNKFDIWISVSSLISLRKEEQLLLMVHIISNSSIYHFPDNITSSFITELPYSSVARTLR